MIDTNRVLKATVAWVSIVYIVCFAVVALSPGIRPAFMQYGLHTMMDLGQNVATITTFISGIVIWNVIAYLSVGLFIVLYNRMRS